MSTSSIPRGPGLFEVTDDGDRAITNIRRLAGSNRRPGSALIFAAMVLLGVLDAGLFAVSLAAQYQYIFRAKHELWPAIIEAVALDAGMIIFSLLALGLARAGQSARIERFLILVCAFGSAGMNLAASDPSSARSVAAYVMPPVFLAIVTDRVIAVVRRHVLGMEEERSAWAVLGRALVAGLAFAGRTVLYGMRLALAPRSTLGGMRRRIVLATPLPVVPVPVPTPADSPRQPLPPGSCMASAASSGDLCGQSRPCPRHEPEIRLPGETKKAHLLRLYADHPDHGDRSAVGRAATALAPHVQLSEGTARAYIYSFLGPKEAS